MSAVQRRRCPLLNIQMNVFNGYKCRPVLKLAAGASLFVVDCALLVFHLGWIAQSAVGHRVRLVQVVVDGHFPASARRSAHLAFVCLHVGCFKHNL